MARAFPVRTWATPLTIGAFVLMAGTGILMFFGLDQGLTTVIHQWFSWFLLIGAGGHILANIKPLQLHLKSRWGRTSVALFAVVFVASFPSWGRVTGPQLKRPIEQALVDAPLSSLAAMNRMGEGVLVGRLKDHGINASSTQSIRELASVSGIGENRLLGLIFLEGRR